MRLPALPRTQRKPPTAAKTTPTRPTSLAQDKGGPSKGGLLNNILCSYSDTYLCNEINGMKY